SPLRFCLRSSFVISKNQIGLNASRALHVEQNSFTLPTAKHKIGIRPGSRNNGPSVMVNCPQMNSPARLSKSSFSPTIPAMPSLSLAWDDGQFEVIDGQQRTLSICQYVNGDFSMKSLFGNKLDLAFHNLQDDQKKRILDYKLMVYFCSGKDSERLEWFRTINIAGEELTDQELKNAVYAGPWTADAKRYFSKKNS